MASWPEAFAFVGFLMCMVLIIQGEYILDTIRDIATAFAARRDRNERK
jgi:hypothetical protein